MAVEQVYAKARSRLRTQCAALLRRCDPNPWVVGKPGVQKYLSVVQECANPPAKVSELFKGAAFLCPATRSRKTIDLRKRYQEPFV